MREKIKCYRFEILSALVIIVLMVICRITNLNDYIDKFISKSNNNNMIVLSSIFIGIYITLVTILATANIPISTKLYEKNTHIKLSVIIKIGLYSNLLLIVCLVFFIEFSIVKYIIFMLFLYSMIIFMETIKLMTLMFKCNIADHYEQTKSQNKIQEDIRTACKHIDSLLTRKYN